MKDFVLCLAVTGVAMVGFNSTVLAICWALSVVIAHSIVFGPTES